MSFQITEAFVQQYSANVMMLSQQKGSRLRPFVRQETVKGKSAFFDRIGSVSAIKKVSRHGNTPQIDTPHSRRMLVLSDYEWADLIDQLDKVRLLNDPQSEYVMAAMWAMGRSMDDEIISAATASAATGETGTGSVALPVTQYVAATDGAAFSNLNTNTLRLIKQKFDAADVDESIPRHIAVTSSQIASLLNDTKITSSDFNTVRALVAGQVDTFMGFKFHRIERLGKATAGDGFDGDPLTGAVAAGTSDQTNNRKVIAWAQDGLLLGIGQDMVGRISERDDKSYATQVYAMMSLGAVRMEEEKVVVALCKES
jgi:hypothetical protein